MRPATSRELREWMGITAADFCVYLAFAALLAMFFVRDTASDISLAVIALALTILSCRAGMASDPEFEDITNVMKAITYPAAVVVVVFVVLTHYVLIAYGQNDCAGMDIREETRCVAEFLDAAL